MAEDFRRPFFTIGHSTRSIEEMAELLRDAGAEIVVDVRKMPRSRANPQFNIDVLPQALEPWGIGYRHLAALGGLRGRERHWPASPNTLWRNRSFRNYADYALTPAFRLGLVELLELGRRRTCAVMCSEALWWRCHRRIIADYLLADGAEVFHIMGPGQTTAARPTPGVRRVADGLIYQEPGDDHQGMTEEIPT
ncbi:hypothetical protein D3C73_1026040 [compost metagenome]|uniref:DUF488 domain-containing protein n=1 Tax=Brevundimonas diminuta TaxID=293 RepID=UPI000FC109A3